MNEFAIRARSVSKAYRLYDNPSDRLLDLFGLLPDAQRKVRQHQALQDITFDIKRGEKIGIIGRNGAGKSTLLKLITRVTEPSSGLLEVHGESRALLQIGTGFHPDFTGRANVAAYLASLGVDDRVAQPMIEDAIAFAELEDYADQPVKTYSTGMGMRLMFAASTMMKPDLLVIDEVLGVGDAYFQRKSFERIREMCEGRETTLLLVTHDIYSASALCDRMIWIDHGRILIDADPPTVTRAYESAVREQEERRLRTKALHYARDRGEHAHPERVIVEIQSQDNQPPNAPVWISRLTLMKANAPLASLRFGDNAFDEVDASYLQREGSNWSEPTYVDGRLARALKAHGSPFHKVAGVFDIALAGELDPKELSVAIDYKSDAPTDLRVVLTATSWRAELGALPPGDGGWTSHVATHAPTPAPPLTSPDAQSAEGWDWEAWTSASEGVVSLVEQGTLQLKWGGPPGPYLLMSPPITVLPRETLLLSVRVKVASGRLGLGALNEAGAWVRTYEFASGDETKTLVFPPAAGGSVQIVLYSAGPSPLDASISRQGRVATDAAVNTRGIYGSGDIRMEGFRVYDFEDRESLVLKLATRARFEIDYRIIRPDLRERAQVLFAFQRNGVDDVYRVMQKDFLFDYAESKTGTLVVEFDPLPLGPGAYSIPIIIAAEGYFDRQQVLYFSINPEAYFVQSKVADIEVIGNHQAYVGTGVVNVGKWKVRQAPATPHVSIAAR